MQIQNFYAQDVNGNIVPGAACALYLPGTTTLATGLQDASGSPMANPFTANGIGLVSFSAPQGLYDFNMVSGLLASTIRIQFIDAAQVAIDASAATAAAGSASASASSAAASAASVLDVLPTLQPLITPGTTGQFYAADKTFKSVTKANVGLANADNTSDTAKPVSTLQQAAIDLKLSIADAANASNVTKGAYQIGFSGRTVGARLIETINVADVKAANPSYTWSQVFDAAQNMLPTDPANVGLRCGVILIPPGNFLVVGVAKKAGVVFRGCGTATRIYNNNASQYCFTSANTGGIQDLGGFEDIIFDGGDPASSSGASRIGFGAINIAAMHAGFAKNCIFQRFAGRAISNQNALSVKFEVNGCFFTGNAIALLMSDGQSTAMHINESYIAFNDYGVLLTGQSDFHICNTIIEQNYLIGLRIDGTIDQGTIDNCYFEQNGAGTGGTKTNILIQGGKSVGINGTLFNMLGSAAGSSGSGWGHIYCADIDNLSITDCTLNSGAGITGFALQGASGGTKAINITNVTTYAGSSLAFADSLATPRLAFSAARVPVPATSTTSGRPGQFAADASFSYFYTGDGTTHTWRRVATVTF